MHVVGKQSLRDCVVNGRRLRCRRQAAGQQRASQEGITRVDVDHGVADGTGLRHLALRDAGEGRHAAHWQRQGAHRVRHREQARLAIVVVQQGELGSTVGVDRLPHRDRARHLVAHHYQRLAVGALGGRHEVDCLGSRIGGCPLQEVPRVEVLQELAALGIRHIEDRQTADALESDERVDPAADRAHSHAFGLRALVVTAVVEGDLVVGRVEVAGKPCSGHTLECIA